MDNLKKIFYLEKSYLLILIFSLIIRSMNIYSLLPSTLDSILFSFLAFLGFFVVLYELYNFLIEKNKDWTDWLILIFLLAFLISIILNRNYGMSSNLKLLVWNSIYVIGIYQFVKRQKNSFLIIDYINYIVMVGMFLLSIISLVMYLFQYSYVYVYGPGPRDHIRIGFLESRLFGVFGDPNYGATTALVTIILCLYYLFKYLNTKNIFIKIFLVVNIVVQFFTLLLTGSRSALLLSYLAVGFLAFSIIFYKQGVKKTPVLKKILYSCMFTLLVLFGYLIVQNGTKDVLVTVPNKIYSAVYKKEEVNGEITGKRKEPISLDRKDVVDNSDISNMRFSIWKSSVEIFKTSPIYGTSPRNLLSYAHDKLPNTFISQKSIVVHNTFLNILTSVGLLGFIPFMIFLIFNGIKIIFCYYFYQRELNLQFLTLLTIQIILVFSGLFNNEIILVNTVGSFLFWSYLGALNGYLKEISIKRSQK
ncbi:O-antigen ligase family protein [Enterococcus faecalis]|nr:O-antigen ligase family protein [Enterococcus faecalis]